MYVVFPINVDYLIPAVRLHIGDIDGKLFSNSVVRTALTAGVSYLSRRWNSRYVVAQSGLYAPSGVRHTHGVYYEDEVDETIVPTLILASGVGYFRFPQGYAAAPILEDNNVLRNPHVIDADIEDPIILHQDEYAIILAASLLLLRTYLTSSIETLVSWSDGEFSYSGIQANKTLKELLEATHNLLENYFKGVLVSALVSE